MDVSICELVLRDGLQGWPEIIPTHDKIELLQAICEAGFTELDVTSFVPPSTVPQFFDATDLLAAVPPNRTTRVLAPNVRGVQRVVDAHQAVRRIDYCGIPFSASEAHNVANLKRTHAEHREQVLKMVELLAEAGIRPLVAVATAFGCPIAGGISEDQVLDIAGWLYEIGVRRLMFGDTTGMADPVRAKRLFSSATSAWPDCDLVAHFHDNRGAGIANTLAAIEAGVHSVDASLGGLGGEPSTVDQGDVGESGNVSTEDLSAVLHRMGIETNLKLTEVLAAGIALERTVGRRLHSRILRAGVISDGPTKG
jgi:hydroxymethylglutaryl-CoA lyase